MMERMLKNKTNHFIFYRQAKHSIRPLKLTYRNQTHVESPRTKFGWVFIEKRDQHVHDNCLDDYAGPWLEMTGRGNPFYNLHKDAGTAKGKIFVMKQPFHHGYVIGASSDPRYVF